MLKLIACCSVIFVILCCCLSAIALIVPASEIGKAALEGIAEGVSEVWEDDRRCLLDGAHPNPQVVLLQSYVPPKQLKKINPQFYTYFGYRDWWRYPLVYPYSIHAVDTTAVGFLTSEDPLENYEEASSSYSIVSGITKLSLDKNYMLLETTDSPFGEPGPDDTITYKIFAFETEEITEFPSEQAMLDEAKKLHFAGSLKLLNINEYDALFTCKK